MTGVSIVGLSGSLIKKAIAPSLTAVAGELQVAFKRALKADDTDPTRVFFGVLFILFAQFFTAFQFVMEEKIMAQYSVEPLVAVGLEGFFGLASVLAVMPVLYLGRDMSVWLDLPRGWRQMVYTPSVASTSVLIALSIGFFNFFGLSVTRSVSATARSTIDTCRTLGIWLVSLGLGWETLQWPFSALQVIGFGLLVYGTFVFNSLVAPPSFLRVPTATSGGVPPSENAPLLGEEEEDVAAAARRSLEETAILPSDLGRSGFDVVPQHQRRRSSSLQQS